MKAFNKQLQKCIKNLMNSYKNTKKTFNEQLQKYIETFNEQLQKYIEKIYETTTTTHWKHLLNYYRILLVNNYSNTLTTFNELQKYIEKI